jgi:K+-transporting ATPase c subunit
MDDKNEEVADFDGVNLRVVHYCVDNDIPYESSIPLDQFKGADGSLDDVRLIKAFNDEKNPLVFKSKTPIPSDAVTASASGLDPEISPANAEMQAARIAKTRGANLEQIEQLIVEHTNKPTLGLLGEPRVNVLLLNRALDERYPHRN